MYEIVDEIRAKQYVLLILDRTIEEKAYNMIEIEGRRYDIIPSYGIPGIAIESDDNCIGKKVRIVSACRTAKAFPVCGDMKPVRAKYISDGFSSFFRKGEVYDGVITKECAAQHLIAFFFPEDETDEPGYCFLPETRFQILGEKPLNENAYESKTYQPGEDAEIQGRADLGGRGRKAEAEIG